MSDVKQIGINSNTYDCKDAAARNPSFTMAGSRSNIASGESLSTLFGKVSKFFNDLKSVAFSGNYSDLTGLPSIPTKTTGNMVGSYFDYTNAGTWMHTGIAIPADNQLVVIEFNGYNVCSGSTIIKSEILKTISPTAPLVVSGELGSTSVIHACAYSGTLGIYCSYGTGTVRLYTIGLS